MQRLRAVIATCENPAVMDELIRIRLAEINPLGTLGPQQGEELLANSEILEPKRNTPLFREGDRDDFNLYLVQGSVRTERAAGVERLIEAGSDSSNYALGNLQPRPFSAFAAADGTIVLKVPRARVEQIIARSQVVTGEMPSVTVTDIAESGAIDGAWMFQVLQSALFRDMPTENIERFMGVIERVELGPGQAVVEQGEAGDYFYMLAEGECDVMRSVNGLEFPIATLQPGDSFGEEALISGLPRNATVRTRDAAVLMRLSQSDFAALFESPAIRSVDADTTRSLVQAAGCTLVDVRMESEHGARSIKGSTNLPLYRLRAESCELDEEKPIITYCDSGTRSRIAAFLLSQRGLDARYLEGGLSALMRQP